MKLETMPLEFQAALPILETLEHAGFEAYFVGGSVRDTLLNQPIHDVDIATSAYPEEVKALFHRTVDTGIQHGTVMILDHGQGYETTTFRTESTYTDFRRPDSVTFVRSLAEDLQRRDFTVNALALKADGEIIDLFDGLGDLERQTIRAVGQAEARFHEDALRMMRAVRFAAQLGFTIESATLAAIKDNAALLSKIAIERINIEFTKLLQGQHAKYGLLELLATNLNAFMPGLEATDLDLVGYADLLGHNQPANAEQAWTLLVFELGLIPRDANKFLKAWKHSSNLINTVQRAIALLNELRKGDVADWLLYQTGTDIDVALTVAQYSEMRLDTTQLRARYANLAIKNKRELALNGADLTKELGLQPGPLFGKILSTLERQVVQGSLPNQAEPLLTAAKAIVAKEEAHK
ncbi:MAG: CCA tRNA nucleotidyltransferase [Lactobacillaceae bacterium]|jgi:tRNA nucleotidyltransferase (CCA-adding enzyme)|nr:CCA tRNA nucleotidyltransferase [Lactobacillaceae bacterium]